MKTIVIEPRSPLSWYFIADSALVNAGKPFYIPEFADEFEVFLAPVVRIGRLGKSIGARFASRYFTEIAPAVHFRASALRRSLLQAGLPTDAAHSFDRALTVGEFLPAEQILDGEPLRLNLTRHPQNPGDEPEIITVECDPAVMRSEIGPLLEAVSRSNTVKMGDLFVPSLSQGIRIEIGDTVTVTQGESTLLTIYIK